MKFSLFVRVAKFPGVIVRFVCIFIQFSLGGFQFAHCSVLNLDKCWRTGMVDMHKESNIWGAGSFFETLVARHNAEAMKVNGFGFVAETRTWGLRSDTLVTYKRRRHAKVAAVTKFADQSACQPGEKKRLNAQTISAKDCLLKYQRNIVLRQICQFLDTDHALKDCLQNALKFNPGCNSRLALKEPVHSCEDWSTYTSQNGPLQDGLGTGATESLSITSSTSVDESKHVTFTELCKFTFSDVIMSEKFAQLCCLFLENFRGLNAEKLFNLNNINARMKEGVYESSPLLFQSDIQEILIKLEKVGSDITALAKCLSDKAITSFREQISSKSDHNFSGMGTHEFFKQQSDMDKSSDRTEVYDLNEARTCRQCRDKADGRNGLVCDSCEGMYHISCIKPVLKEIPSSWYCSNCTAKGTESSHDNCVACERLDAGGSPFNGSGQDTVEQLETSSIKLDAPNKAKQSAQCKTCRTEVTNEEYLICSHSLCAHKFYHVKCLTSMQLISYGPCWYCPSCLCGHCFSDRDDDEILRCDGCNHAYHTYCVQLPRSTRPKGKWYCQTCNSGIQRVQRARRLYEKISRKRNLDGRIKSENESSGSGNPATIPE